MSKKTKALVEVNKAANRVLKASLSDLNAYDAAPVFKERNIDKPSDVRTTAELCAYLQNNPDAQIEARIVGYDKSSSSLKYKSIMDKTEFLEAFQKGDKHKFNSKKLRESFDRFFGDGVSSGAGGSGTGLVGQDFVPLLGGPFYKNLYYYNDLLQQFSAAFFAYNHDPIAHAIISIISDFTMGKGYRVDCDDEHALAIWRAFEEVNDIPLLMQSISRELPMYGEHMLWFLPNDQKYIMYPPPRKGEDIPKAMIPRVRLVDPSNIVEIITYPEDITRKLFYIWNTPTQYQIYTRPDPKTGKVVQGSKFIYQQIPADQMLHYKINAVDNEKRGRSELFPVMGYLKRLRDAVNYSIISSQKNAAWCIDTTIKGDQTDIDNYMSAQQDLGTIAPAGSEFVHTDAVVRQYLANQSGGSRGGNAAFEWTLSMVAAGVGIPVSYFGTHLSGGQTRASALVSTEPVAKKFEKYQLVYERIIKDMASRLFKKFGITADIEVTFPEIITQDRSAKIKDVFTAQSAGWLSERTAATIVSKELGITDYEYDTEIAEINKEKAAGDWTNLLPGGNSSPLTSPGAAAGSDADVAPSKPSAVTGTQKKTIKDNHGA